MDWHCYLANAFSYDADAQPFPVWYSGLYCTLPQVFVTFIIESFDILNFEKLSSFLLQKEKKQKQKTVVLLP